MVPGAGPNTYAYDVTDLGWVVGAFAPPNAGGWRGFIYEVATGSITQLNPAVSNGGCIARAANNQGMVVGSRTISSTAYNAFVYQNGKYVDLGVKNGPNSEAVDIAESGTVAGWCGSSIASTDTRAFISRNANTLVLPPIPGGLSSSALAVNAEGDAVGFGLLPVPGWGNVSRAFIYKFDTGRIDHLGTLERYRRSFANAISADRIVIGEARTLANGSNGSAACIWKDGQIYNLNALLNSSAGIYLYSAESINQSNQILCCASAIPYGEVAVVLSPLPPPVGDITSDCRVNVSDLLLVINEWGKSKSVADINMDGIVNIHDLLLVIKHWDTS